MKKLLGGFALTVAAGAAIAGITGISQDTAATQPVSRVLGGLERSDLFVRAAARVNLDQHADGARPWTLFVPSDQALPREGSAFLLETVLPAPANEARLAEVVGYHLVPGARFDAVAPMGETTLFAALTGQHRHQVERRSCVRLASPVALTALVLVVGPAGAVAALADAAFSLP